MAMRFFMHNGAAVSPNGSTFHAIPLDDKARSRVVEALKSDIRRLEDRIAQIEENLLGGLLDQFEADALVAALAEPLEENKNLIATMTFSDRVGHGALLPYPGHWVIEESDVDHWTTLQTVKVIRDELLESSELDFLPQDMARQLIEIISFGLLNGTSQTDVKETVVIFARHTIGRDVGREEAVRVVDLAAGLITKAAAVIEREDAEAQKATAAYLAEQPR